MKKKFNPTTLLPTTQEERQRGVLIAALVSVALLIVVFILLVGKTPNVEPPTPPVITTSDDVKITTATSSVSVQAPFTKGMTKTQKKETLLSLINTPKSKPLTEDQKRYILQEFGGERTATFGFTLEEKELIVRRLNGR